MMRYPLLLSFCCLASLNAAAQDASAVINELKAIDGHVRSDTAAAISNRGMNIFLADKTGYLSLSRDLSFYTNYVTYNSSEGKLTVNHNFQPVPGTDDPVKNLFSIGFNMTLANSYAKGFFDNRYENELGLSIGHTWIGKVSTRLGRDQKKAMDALRFELLQSLIAGIREKENDLENRLNNIDSSALPGQNISSAKQLIRENFYAALKAAYEEKYALDQASLLTGTNNFKRITTGWTSIHVYLPLVFPSYYTAASLIVPLNQKHPYAASLTLQHTRLWESSKTGRLFISAGGGAFLNNSKLIYGLNKLNAAEYKSLGGTGITDGNNKLYIGNYQTFFTGSVTAKAVYFPHESHFGISLLVEQYFGTYHWLNLKIALPVVLINSRKTPAVNIECYLLVLNCSNQPAFSNDARKTELGLSLGIPFSRLMF